MAILFRPVFPVDEPHWIPALQEALTKYDIRIWPDAGDLNDIEYLVAWKIFDGEAHCYPNLKAVLSLSAGVNQYVGNDNFPQQAKLIRMIEPGLDQQMMEYVLSYVLRYHREHDQMAEIAAEAWSSYIPKLATERRVGILGLGHLGQVCAEKLVSIGFDVRGWSRSEKDIDGITCFAGQDNLEAFLSSSDILVCLLPFTPETENILNKDTLSQLPQGSCIINAARGPLLVDDDLTTLLDSGHLGGATLDVFRQEPLPKDHPFWNHPKIHITPHVAAITVPKTGVEHIRCAIDAIERGENPEGLVDINRGY